MDDACVGAGVVVPGGISGFMPGGRIGHGLPKPSVVGVGLGCATSVDVRLVGSLGKACVSSCVWVFTSCLGCGGGAYVGEDPEDDPGGCGWFLVCCAGVGWIAIACCLRVSCSSMCRWL